MASSTPTRRCCSKRAALICGFALLLRDERPTAETKLCMAPYWNCYDNGVCCTGSMKIPQEKSVAAIDLWEESFFQSEFTHASGVRKHVRFRGGFLAMWQSLAGTKERFQRSTW